MNELTVAVLALLVGLGLFMALAVDWLLIEDCEDPAPPPAEEEDER